MRLFFVFLSLLIISTPAAFAETITLKCDYDRTTYDDDYNKLGPSVHETEYLKIDLSTKKVFYISGNPHKVYKIVDINEGIIQLQGSADFYGISGTISANINRYTGDYSSFTSIKAIDKSGNGLSTNTQASGSCQPYTPKQLF